MTNSDHLNSPDSANLEQQLRRLGALSPSPDSTAHAIAAAQSALQNLKPTPRRRMWIPLSLAASLVIVLAGLLLMSLTQSRASAAEQLGAAVATSQAYKGWITITTITNDPSKNPRESKRYLDTATGIAADTRGANANLEASFRNPTTREIQIYNATTNTIRIGELAPETIDRMEHPKQKTPCTYDELLAHLHQLVGKAPHAITLTRDGPLNRFDLTAALAASAADLKAAGQDNSLFELQNLPQIIWTDPQSGLIQKTLSHDITETYAYTTPPVASLYDLGVPRSAEIYDNRPTKETRDVLDRLNSRIAAAFDNAVCAQYTERHAPASADHTTTNNFRLYARAGKDWILRIEPVIQTDPQPPAFALPKHWATTGADELLTRLRDTPPNTQWQGNANEVTLHELKDGKSILTHRFTDATVPILARHMNPAYFEIYPSNAFSPRYSADNHVDLLHDPARPGQVALHVTYLDTRTDKLRAEYFYWIDPTHEDRPVTTIELSYQPDGKSLAWKSITEFSDYAATATQSYPTHWVKTDYPPSQNGSTPPTASTTTFIILPAKTLADVLKPK